MIKNHKSGIYAIRNKIDGKVYIGQSKSCTIRWRQHKYLLSKNKHYNSHLQLAINKYGIGNFEFVILEECSLEDRDNRERYWINHFHALDNKYGYNNESGGCFSKSLSDETKQKISNATKGHVGYMLGKKVSNETKQKLSLIKIGVKHSEEHKLNNSNAQKGKKLSIETKEKICLSSKNRKGYKHSEETKIKLRDRNLGKKHSEETKKKLSDTMKRIGNKPPSFKGKTFTDEQKEAISIRMKGNKNGGNRKTKD